MTNFYKDAMNIPIADAEYGFNGVVDPEYARGHQDALIAASKIALDADVKIDGLEAQLAAAQADIKILQANVSYQIERNANNVANAELRIADLQAEIARLREGGCAKGQYTTQYCAEAATWSNAAARYAEHIAKMDIMLAEAKELLLQAHEPDQGQLRVKWDKDVDEWLVKVKQAAHSGEEKQ